MINFGGFGGSFRFGIGYLPAFVRSFDNFDGGPDLQRVMTDSPSSMRLVNCRVNTNYFRYDRTLECWAKTAPSGR